MKIIFKKMNCVATERLFDLLNVLFKFLNSDHDLEITKA